MLITVLLRAHSHEAFDLRFHGSPCVLRRCSVLWTHTTGRTVPSQRKAEGRGRGDVQTGTLGYCSRD